MMRQGKDQSRPRWRSRMAFSSSATIFLHRALLLFLFCRSDAFECSRYYYHARPISVLPCALDVFNAAGIARKTQNHVLKMAKEKDMTSEEKRRENGKKAAAAAAQKLVDSGEAATLDEAMDLRMARAREAFEAKYTKEEISEQGKRAAAAAAQRLIDSGKAATLDEAMDLHMARARDAFEAKYTKEEISELSKRAAAAAAQMLVDKGDATSIEEAHHLLGLQGWEAKRAKYTEGEISELGKRAAAAAAQILVDKGDATTIEEAHHLLGLRAWEAKRAKYTDKEIAELGMKAGVISAIKLGKRTKYPGVTFIESSGKWRVQVYIKGKRVHVGCFSSELEGAKAHDEYVRKHGLKRPLHFPREGETSSQSSQT